MNVRCASLWTDFAPDTYTHSRPRYGQFPRVLFIAQVFLLLREREKKKKSCPHCETKREMVVID
jgi:hypothetical protein